MLENASGKDVQSLLDGMTRKPCAACRHDHLYNDKSNRGDLCEICWMTKWRAEFDQAQAAEREEREKTDAKMKEQGFTHRVTAWVHPHSQGGDDYQIDIYFKGLPQKEMIRQELKCHKSDVLDYHDPS
jgi:hypothetical protein